MPVDWSVLGDLGSTFTGAYEKARKQKNEDEAPAAIAALLTGKAAADAGDAQPPAIGGATLGNLGGGGAPRPAGQPMKLSEAGADTGDKSLPRGLRNMNPGNIIDGPFAQGLPGYAGSDGRFARFASMADGLNASSENLASYGRKGINTIASIVNRWAPAGDGDNNPSAYAATVARSLGIHPQQPLDMSDPEVRSGLAQAMASVENGRPFRIADYAAPQPAARAAAAPAAAMDSPTAPPILATNEAEVQAAERATGMMPTQTAAADLPAPGAQEAQARFAVPQPGAAPQAAPAGAAAKPATAFPTGGAPLDRNLAQVNAMLAHPNPEVRKYGMGLATKYLGADRAGTPFDYNGTLIQRGADGMYHKVLDPKSLTTVKDDSGNTYAFDPAKGTTTKLFDGKDSSSRSLITPEERQAAGVDPGYKGTVQMDADGKLSFPGKAATEVNIDQKGEGEFEKEFGKKAADRFNNYIIGADKAQSMVSDIGQLREISRRVGQIGAGANLKAALGPYADAVGANISGLSDIQAFESVIQRMAPNMHVAGSGATSDVEFKGFLKSLPQLTANPAAREMILDTMEGFARRQMQQGDIAVALQNKEMTRSEAEKKLRSLGDPLAAYREFKKTNPDLAGSPAADAPKALPKEADRAPIPGGMSAAAAFAEAKAAVKAGRDPGPIREKLRTWGIDPARLD